MAQSRESLQGGHTWPRVWPRVTDQQVKADENGAGVVQACLLGQEHGHLLLTVILVCGCSNSKVKEEQAAPQQQLQQRACEKFRFFSFFLRIMESGCCYSVRMFQHVIMKQGACSVQCGHLSCVAIALCFERCQEGSKVQADSVTWVSWQAMGISPSAREVVQVATHKQQGDKARVRASSSPASFASTLVVLPQPTLTALHLPAASTVLTDKVGHFQGVAAARRTQSSALGPGSYCVQCIHHS